MQFALCLAISFAVLNLCSASACTDQGGQCLNYYDYKCTAGYESGLCPGGSEVKCCNNCNAQCVSTENSYDDRQCDALGGECWDNSNYCSGSYVSGKCEGPAERQCCTTSSGSGSCTLVQYSSSIIQGWSGLKVWVEPGFVDSMDRIHDHAAACKVWKVWVTHAYRKADQNLGGTVVEPATYSNHLVGHAIDMNVESASGFCNGNCLMTNNNPEASCFIDRVLLDASLRWGGIWSSPDPVHIDDYYNGNMAAWEDLYYEIQDPCQGVDN